MSHTTHAWQNTPAVCSPATLPPSSMTMELRTMSFRPQLDGSAYGPCSVMHEATQSKVGQVLLHSSVHGCGPCQLGPTCR